MGISHGLEGFRFLESVTIERSLHLSLNIDGLGAWQLHALGDIIGDQSRTSADCHLEAGHNIPSAKRVACSRTTSHHPKEWFFVQPVDFDTKEWTLA